MTTATIDVCVPAIGIGARFFTYLVANFLRLADAPDRVRFVVSHHTEADRRMIEATDAGRRVAEWVPVAPASTDVLFHSSANHASAINALVARSTADVVLVTDFDMAFLTPSWDRILCERLHDGGIDLLGVAYPPILTSPPPDMFRFKNDPALASLLAWATKGVTGKYQHLPNLSFMAIPRRVFERCFPDGAITRFDRHLMEGGLPFRLINSPRLSRETRLPMGTIQWLDTGFELTERIAEHGLRCVAMPMRPVTTTEVFADRAAFGPVVYPEQPEVYDLDGVPFLAHFRKGSAKAAHPQRADRFSLFEAAVDAYVAARSAA